MSSSRKESERTKFVQEKCQTLLTLMLRDEDNKYCVDCDAKGPRWASWNLGVFLCIRCAGIHRNLGVHISRVKSVNLDSWTPEQVVSLQQMGNSRARAVYEAQLPDGFRRPQTDSALESFIRAKYEHKKYVAREWVQPPPVKANWDKEIEEEMEKQKRKKKGLGIASITATSNGKQSTDTKKTVVSLKSTPLPAPLPKPTNNSNSPKTSSRIIVNNNAATTATSDNASTVNDSSNLFSSDLLGLSSPIGAGTVGVDNKMAAEHNDVFSCFLSAPVSSNANEKNGLITTNTTVTTTSAPASASAPITAAKETSLAQEEQDFFNQIPTEKEKAKLTKDSILALYGQGPAMGQFSNHQTTTFVPQMMGANAMNTSVPIGNVQNAFGTGIPMQYQSASGAIPFGTMPTMQQSTGPIQPPPSTVNSFGFPATMQQNVFPTNPATNPTNINQQFGNLNLGNVWQ